MYAGGIGEVQSLDTALRALALLGDRPELALALAGVGVAVPRLQRLADDLRLGDRVRFLGGFPMAEMPALMAEADAQLVSLKDLPLFHGTIPSKLQASMACGAPIVCAVAGDAADVVRRAGCGFTATPEDRESLAAAFRQLADATSGELADMGSRARSTYVAELGEDSGAAALEELLRDGRLSEAAVTRVAVLGATGFVGSAVVDALQRRGAEVITVPAPRLSSTAGSPAALASELESDAASAAVASLRTALQECGAVVNAAGVARATSGWDPDMVGANALLPLVIAHARPEGARLVHVSSVAVQGRAGVLDETARLCAVQPVLRLQGAGRAGTGALLRRRHLPADLGARSGSRRHPHVDEGSVVPVCLRRRNGGRPHSAGAGPERRRRAGVRDALGGSPTAGGAPARPST